MRVLTWLENALLLQRGHLFPWVPVCLAIGIGAYFSLRWEPELPVYVTLSVTGCLSFALARRFPGAWSPLAVGAALIATGFCLAGARAHSVAAPVLDWRYYGPIEGRVVGLDRSASDRLRVTLDQVRLERVAPNRRPNRVRISLSDDAVEVVPGQRIMTTGHLSPPQGPVEPGGFDFRRHAWFKELGGVGYTRNPIMTIAPPQSGRNGMRVFAWRMSASDRVRAILPGDVGGFAAAVTTGDRSAVGQGALTVLRTSNLAHLLAISGLHMGLLTGFVFTLLRMGLSLFPALALRAPVKKVAAVGALLAAAAYLALSGGNVATERAFVMVAVMLGALLFDRRALSLRAVAVAALIVLFLRPEALLSPGFQMSFAATVALVAVFGWIRDREIRPSARWVRAVLGLVVSSAVAGAATAPIGAAHFNTLSHYGLIANLLSVPLMGMLVIPAAVLAACLMPFGLDWIGFHLMGLGLRWILSVAHRVSEFDGAQGYVLQPASSVLPLLAIGALWVILWQGRARHLGVGPIVAAFWIWSQAERPTVLIAESGGLVGVMTEQGRALSKPRGSGFVATVWLENDGDAADQKLAANRWPGNGHIPHAKVGPMRLLHVPGKRAARSLTECSAGQIIVSAVPVAINGPCRVFDPEKLRETGSLSIDANGITAANTVSGTRLWHQARTKQDQ